MKSAVLAFVAGLAVAGATSALAVGYGTSVTLAPGDTATLGEGFGEGFGPPICEATLKNNTPTFRCHIGSEYRKRYSVAINEREVTVSKYFGPSASKPYRVIFHRSQRPGWIAHK